MSDTVLVWNLNERVYEELRTRVLTRQEPAGAKLSLHVLAAELGVSRSPVHHALTRLVSEGLLTVRPRRGYYVAPVTADTAAVTEHGQPFAAVVQRGRVAGVQFHPEKSGDVGLRILRNFLQWTA